MKRVTMIFLALAMGVCFIAGALAADKDAIKKQVDEIVVAINGGKKAEDFKKAPHNEPYYVFIMEQDGMLLVHPLLAGQNLKEKAEPVYDECAKATTDGVWVEYMWKGKQKHTYERKTNNGLIVSWEVATQSNEITFQRLI